jgi:probable blue pigment (indigoidine) exporter
VAFTYTVIVPGIGATLIWFMLVDRIGATPASVYHFLTPFFGVMTAALLLDEKIGFMDVVGVLIITAGIWAVQMAKQKCT